MSQRNIKPDLAEEELRQVERERATAKARADLMRRAEAQGVKPFDPDEWRAELDSDNQPQEEIQREVDEFLKMMREWRDTPSNRSID